METQEEKIERVIKEEAAVAPYNSKGKEAFEDEKGKRAYHIHMVTAEFKEWG